MITFPCFVLEKNEHGSQNGFKVNNFHSFHFLITKSLYRKKLYDGGFTFENSNEYVKKLGWEIIPVK
ncbi:MAG: hypothetical protein EBX50_01325 [Chitinophagia bacterium]|nr:hypothetical protein [Chitinophagia bacterium]